jgi:hypothetical protein
MKDYKEVNKETKISIISEIEKLGFKKIKKFDVDESDTWRYVTEGGTVYSISFNKMMMHLISFNNNYLSLNRVKSDKAIIKFYGLIDKTVSVFDKDIKRKVRNFKIDSLAH